MGKFGKFVELTQQPRKEHQKSKFFTFTPNTWKKFCEQAPNLNIVGNSLEVSKKKMITVTMYNSYLYRNFATQLGRGTAYINIFPSVWENLLKVIVEVNNILHDDAPCQTCANQMKFVKLFGGRLKESELTGPEQVEVENLNMNVNNQLGVLCDYCGNQHNGECHCHRVDCRQCSPGCFCGECGKCVYYVY